MVCEQVLKDLFSAFPDAIINHNLEFVADPSRRVNSYFRLDNCETRTDVIAKVLERLSRDASCSAHFCQAKRNDRVHQYHRNGINWFLGTDFTREDMEMIYTYLGNAIHHQKTLEFIRSGYDMKLLNQMEE